jgi:predicted ArsR family transcriptional regulator
VSLRDKLTITQRILIVLARYYCLDLDELSRRTGVDKETLKVYLSRLARKGVVTRRWRHLKVSIGGDGREHDFKRREYCLKTTIKEELGVE